MHATLPLLRQTDFPPLRRKRLDTLQVNLGYRCNQSCLHCHVNAGPGRKEQMQADIIDAIIRFLDGSGLSILDMTGGAPEMNPHFRRLVESARSFGMRVIDRCNLTILNEPGYEDLGRFLAEHEVEIVASLPCYLESNVDSQRGDGVYASSIHALRYLNSLGYAQADSGLQLNLMYNPTGPVLPPEQKQLEQDYRRELAEREAVSFNRLFVLANMPIQRFGSTLVSRGGFDDYMALLKGAYQPVNLEQVMCRSLLSVDWQGYLYDCDFNQMLNLPLELDSKVKIHISELNTDDLEDNPIIVCDHCYGCTAGQGSSCGGALD